MAKIKHHYVPQFYLREFSSNPPRRTQVHLYNLERRRAIESVSLQDQCYKNRLHGSTDEIEDAISTLETRFAVLLHGVVASSSLPEQMSAEHGLLYTFVALQMLRTTRSGDLINSGVDKMVKQAFHDDSRVEGMDLDLIRVGFENPVLAAFGMLDKTMNAIGDLQMHLLCAGEGQSFVTSDNPVYKYNQYMEGWKGIGVTGTLNTGIQIFVPLSPRHLLMLYDGRVYDVGAPGAQVTRKLRNSDITTLNSLQVHGADRNLYFSSWADKDYVEYIVRRSVRQRIDDPVQVDEFVDPEDELHSLVVQYQRMPNLALRLSFVGVTEEAIKIPRQLRIQPPYNLRRNLDEVVPPPTGASPPPEGRMFVPRSKVPNDKARFRTDGTKTE